MAGQETFSGLVSGKADPGFEIFSAAFSLVMDGDGMTEDIGRLSPEARVVYLLWYLDGEIHSGGFDSLFTNALGNHCTEISAHLALLGSVNNRRLLGAAMACFPDGIVPADREQRLETWIPLGEDRNVMERLAGLDREYCRCEDRLAGRLDDYVRSHPAARLGTGIPLGTGRVK